MSNRPQAILLSLGLIGSLWLSQPILAQGVPETREALPEAQQEEADRAIGHIKSPWCPGLMLEVCPSPQAEAFRDSIHAVAAQGVRSDSIVEMMLAQIGEEWRAYPKASGQGLLAWVVPPAMLILGLLFVALVLRRMRERNPEDLPELTEEQERQVEDVLGRLEQAEREASEVY